MYFSRQNIRLNGVCSDELGLQFLYSSRFVFSMQPELVSKFCIALRWICIPRYEYASDVCIFFKEISKSSYTAPLLVNFCFESSPLKSDMESYEMGFLNLSTMVIKMLHLHVFPENNSCSFYFYIVFFLVFFFFNSVRYSF